MKSALGRAYCWALELMTALTPALGGFLHPAFPSILELSLSTRSNDPLTFDLQWWSCQSVMSPPHQNTSSWKTEPVPPSTLTRGVPNTRDQNPATIFQKDEADCLLSACSPVWWVKCPELMHVKALCKLDASKHQWGICFYSPPRLPKAVNRKGTPPSFSADQGVAACSWVNLSQTGETKQVLTDLPLPPRHPSLPLKGGSVTSSSFDIITVVWVFCADCLG